MHMENTIQYQYIITIHSLPLQFQPSKSYWTQYRNSSRHALPKTQIKKDSVSHYKRNSKFKGQAKAEKSGILIEKIQTNVDCNGSSTGSIGITVTGGTGTYTYDWDTDEADDFDDNEDLVGLTAGFYNVIVKDTSGCTAILENIEI